MQLFSEQPKTQTSIEGQPPQIDTGVLTALKLSQEQDIDSHFKNLEVENNKKEIAAAATEYYKEAQAGSISFADPKAVKLGEIALNPQVREISDIPDSISDQLKKMEGVMHPEDRDHIKIYFQTFAEHFGKAALDAKDWKTAVKSFDLATEGGIKKALNIVEQLGEFYKDDVDTRRQIALLVQERINAKGKNQNFAAETPANQAPVELKPAPGITPSTETGQTTTTTKPEPAAAQSITHTSDTLVQPVGVPGTPILGEKDLRAAPPNPNNP